MSVEGGIKSDLMEAAARNARIKAAEEKIEEIVGQLFTYLYALRVEGAHQTAYDDMGIIMNMLMEDRHQILRANGVKS